MDLHRVTGKADWQKVTATKHNAWQRTAAATNGVVTPGNALTLLGFGLVLAGLFAINGENYRLGASLLATGRLLDIADGLAADHTGTKSPLGESLDAGFDKLGTVLAAGVFIYVAVAPRWLLLALIVPHVIMTLIFLIAQRRSVRIHPSRVGKLSMAGVWVSLVGFILLKATNSSSSSIAAITVDGLAIIAAAAGIYTAVTYATKLRVK